jgi:hypothetical protein
MDSQKKKLIDQHLLPAFSCVNDGKDELAEHLYSMCCWHQAIRSQVLESPGDHHSGRAWFSIDAMVQSYYYCPVMNLKWGSRIWKKHEFIVYCSSLMHHIARPDYIEILEPGEILSISYNDLSILINRFPILLKSIQDIAIGNEKYYHDHSLLVRQPPLKRVSVFEQWHPLFVKVAGRDAMAMHIGLTRQGYNQQLRKLNPKKEFAFL